MISELFRAAAVTYLSILGCSILFIGYVEGSSLVWVGGIILLLGLLLSPPYLRAGYREIRKKAKIIFKYATLLLLVSILFILLFPNPIFYRDSPVMAVGSWSLPRVGAGLVVIGFIGFFGVFFVRPFVTSLSQRYPGILFPTASLRIQTIREEIQDYGWQWAGGTLFRDKQSLLTYWSVLWVVPSSILVVAALATLDLGLASRIRPEIVQHGWQAQLTLISLSFIVLIFLLEQMSRAEHREGVIQEIFGATRIMPVIYFTLGLSGFVAYLYVSQPANTVAPAVVEATFITFFGTVLGIGYVYYRVARLIFLDPLDEITVAQIQRGIALQLRARDRQAAADAVLESRLPDFVKDGINHDDRLYMAQDLGLEGYITDIDLDQLAAVCHEHCDLFDGSESPTLLFNLQLGAELQPGVPIVSVTDSDITPDDVPDEFVEELTDAIYCSDHRPWRTGDRLVERNMGRIREETQDAINTLSPVQLENYLGLYIELLHHLVRTNRQVNSDEGTPAPLLTLIKQIYREFYHILEGIAQTGSSDLINTARAEIYRLSMAHHRQQESYLFSKSIGLYASYYRVLAASPNADYELINSLLTSLENFQTTLTADLDRARSYAEADHAASDLDEFYDVLERLLQTAVDEEDAQTFNNVWNLGEDDFVLVQPVNDLFQLCWERDEAEDDAEQRRLERKIAIKQRQQEAIETCQSQFEETQFVAAAWAYREVREDNLAEPVFQEMFSESFKRYQLSTLADIYFQLSINSRFNLLRWESEDSDVFKGARISQPAVHSWLQEFFCAMALLFLEVDEYDTDEVPETSNPLLNSEVERRSYPDFWDTIDAISKEELALTGVGPSEYGDMEKRKAVFLALHESAQQLLKRREEDRVVDADLDLEVIDEFKTDYISTFTDEFVLRTVFNELGWLNIQPYDEDVEANQNEYNLFYPKQGFITDPPVDFIHNLNRQVRDHIRALQQAWLDDQEPLAEKQTNAYSTVPDTLTTVCEEHTEAGDTPRAILVSGVRVTNVLTESNTFDSKFQPSEAVIGGFAYDDTLLPVYRIPSRNFAAVVLFETDQPVTLTEYHRDDAPVFVKIEKVTRQLLEELNSIDLDKLSDEELRERLQQVKLQAIYYSQLDVSENFGTKITVPDQPQ